MLYHPDIVQETLAIARDAFCTSPDPEMRRQAYNLMHFTILHIRFDAGDWAECIEATRAEVAAALREADQCIEAMRQHQNVIQKIALESKSSAQTFIALHERRLHESRQQCEIFERR